MDGFAPAIGGFQDNLNLIALTGQAGTDDGSQAVYGQANVQAQQRLTLDLILSQTPEILRARVPDQDIEMLIDNDGARAQAAENGAQKCIGTVDFLRALVQFVINGLQLFIGGLQLFVHGLELFVGGLQLFIGGFELFIAGLELLVRRFQLFVARL